MAPQLTRFFMFLVCELVFITGRHYLLSESKTVIGKLVPPLLLQLFILIFRSRSLTWEFSFYLIGDYYLFFVHSLQDVESLTFGILAFLVGHLIAIWSLFPTSPVQMHLFSFLWFLAGILIGILCHAFHDDWPISLTLSLYIITLTFRLNVSLFSTFEQLTASILFCISDLIILVDLLVLHGNNKIIQGSILITYWISLVFRLLPP